MARKGRPFPDPETGEGPNRPRGRADRLASLLAPARRASDLPPLDDAALTQVLKVRINEAGNAARRAHWIGGRLVNALTGQDPEYTQLSGRHLHQVFGLLGLDTPATVKPDHQYRVRVDLLRDALARLDARAKDRPGTG